MNTDLQLLLDELEHITKRSPAFTKSPGPNLVGNMVTPGKGRGFFQMPPFVEATALGPNPALKKLGYGPRDRLLIVHVDDIGLCQSNVEGLSDLNEVGIISSASVMMPTAWSSMAAAYAKAHPNMDIGVHMTVTSEWESNRWGALSTVDTSSGLLDPDGYLWQHGEDLIARAKGKVIHKEMEAQAKAAIEQGMVPTHFDSHQFVVLQAYIMDYIRVCLAHHVPPIFIRRDKAGFQAIGGIDPGFISMAVLMVKTFELFKVPLLDNMYMMPLENPDTRLEDTQAILKQITPGITLFICHCTKPSPELPAITFDSPGRFADYQTWMNEDMRKFLQAEGIHTIGWGALKNIMPK
jgi:hypothetical protein